MGEIALFYKKSMRIAMYGGEWMKQEKIDRINALARKSRGAGLNAEEEVFGIRTEDAG